MTIEDLLFQLARFFNIIRISFRNLDQKEMNGLLNKHYPDSVRSINNALWEIKLLLNDYNVNLAEYQETIKKNETPDLRYRVIIGPNDKYYQILKNEEKSFEQQAKILKIYEKNLEIFGNQKSAFVFEENQVYEQNDRKSEREG